VRALRAFYHVQLYNALLLNNTYCFFLFREQINDDDYDDDDDDDVNAGK